MENESPADRHEATRRDFMTSVARGAGLVALGGLSGVLWSRSSKGDVVWQIDPAKCIQCGNCETDCVLDPSAVRVVNVMPICGYCDRCFGYYRPDAVRFDDTAENQLCPVAAIKRRYVEDPYYEYTIDVERCIACGLCVKECKAQGNASFQLQVQQDLCVHCNQCSIADACEGNAFVRTALADPYLATEEI
jgi:electron transport complex protein RnfB